MSETYRTEDQWGNHNYFCTLCEGWVNTDKHKDPPGTFTVGEHSLEDCIRDLAYRVAAVEKVCG